MLLFIFIAICYWGKLDCELAANIFSCSLALHRFYKILFNSELFTLWTDNSFLAVETAKKPVFSLFLNTLSIINVCVIGLHK